MKDTEKLKTLQLLYAVLMADTMWILEKYQILDFELNQKIVEHTLSAPVRVHRFKLKSPIDVFLLHGDLNGFTEWKISKTSFGFEISTENCTLRNICKSMNTLKPCKMFCVLPLNALCEALLKPYRIEVQSTLWENEKCLLNIVSININ